jgi:hypothetical protein
LSRKTLEQLPLRSLHRARNWSKADVSVQEWPLGSGQLVAVKDLKPRPLWFRILIGRYYVRREWKALCALHGVEGVPRPITRIDSDAFAMELRPGRQANEYADGTLPAEVIVKLEALIAAIHARGVAHGDLHQDNILVNENGEVSLIDWATASIFGAQPRGAKRWTFEEWAALDDRAVAKLKVLHAPHLINERERDILIHGGSRAYRAIKKLRGLRERIKGKKSGERAAVLRKYIEHVQNETESS